MVKMIKIWYFWVFTINVMIRSLKTIPLDRGDQYLQNEYQHVEIPIKNGGEIRVTKKVGFCHFNFCWGVPDFFCFHFFSAVSHSIFNFNYMIV